MSNEYSYVQVQQQWGAERRFVSEISERGWPPFHLSSQNNPGGEFETTPQVSGDFLDYDPGREDPNSMPGYRDAEFEIPLLRTGKNGQCLINGASKCERVASPPHLFQEKRDVLEGKCGTYTNVAWHSLMH